MSINEKMTAIANNMRNKLETTEKLGLDEMAAAVDSIYVKAHEQGIADGKQTAYNEVEPLNEELEQTLYGTDTGGKSHYDAFWDAYQDNGNRVNYQYGFSGYGWNKRSFKPKHSIRPNTINTGFHSLGSDVTNLEEDGIDFVEVFDDRGLVYDTSNCSNFLSAFMWAKVKRISVFDVRKDTSKLSATFAYGQIKIIEKLIVGENNDFVNTFQNQSSLEKIIFEGVIAKNGLNLQWSTKLSKASIESIINCLSTTTSGLTITLSKTAKENAFTDDEWAALIATKSNWTISLV